MRHSPGIQKSWWPCGKRKIGATQAEADRLFSELDIPAHTLMAFKPCNMPGGADWIRSRNLRTHLADEKYGPGWLDRTEEEEFARARAAGRH